MTVRMATSIIWISCCIGFCCLCPQPSLSQQAAKEATEIAEPGTREQKAIVDAPRARRELLVATAMAGAPDFSAEMTVVRDGRPAQGNLYVKQGRYRWETDLEGSACVILADPHTGTVQNLFPDKLVYQTVKGRSTAAMANNPLEAFRVLSGHYPFREAGREKINDRVCRKIEFLGPQHVFMTAWIDPKLDFPIKVSNPYYAEMNFELNKVTLTTVDAALMQAPSAYAKVAQDDSEGRARRRAIQPGQSRSFEIDTTRPLRLVIADDGVDGGPSEGVIRFFLELPKAKDPHETPFRLPNGKSHEIRYPANGHIRQIEIQVIEGAIFADLEQ